MPNSKSKLTVILGLILIGSLILTPFNNSADAAPSIQIMNGDTVISSDVEPYIVDGATWVPISIINQLGKRNSSAIWDHASKTVTITTPNKQITLHINPKETLPNAAPIDPTPSATLKEGRVMVPLRFLGESMDEKVTWDAAKRIIYIGEASTTSATNNNSDTTSAQSAAQTLRKSREAVLGLNVVPLGTELPTIGIQTLIRYFPVGQSDMYFDATDDLITFYTIKNNKRHEIWSANYKMDMPVKHKELPFFPYKITKEIGERPTITTPVAYYVYRGAISDLHYGLIDLKGNETEIGHTDPAQTKEYFPVSEKELALLK